MHAGTDSWTLGQIGGGGDGTVRPAILRHYIHADPALPDRPPFAALVIYDADGAPGGTGSWSWSVFCPPGSGKPRALTLGHVRVPGPLGALIALAQCEIALGHKPAGLYLCARVRVGSEIVALVGGVTSAAAATRALGPFRREDIAQIQVRPLDIGATQRALFANPPAGLRVIHAGLPRLAKHFNLEP